MLLTTLRLRNFRNHIDSRLEFGGGTNILLGDNGQGKTNIIEAISYLCLTKSFYAGSDTLVLNIDNDFFEISGTIVLDGGAENHIRVTYVGSQAEKVATVNGHSVEPFSSIVGKFPIVICSPEHAPMTMGGPAERRKFVDFVVSQSSAKYFQNLIQYRKVIKHRNKILLDGKISRRDISGILVPWDDQLVRLGSYLVYRRKTFIHEFQDFLSAAYRNLVAFNEEPTVSYAPNTSIDQASQISDIEELLKIDLHLRNAEEKQIGTTLVGPHRDEFVFKINGLDLRKYASQGQHKTFLIALKIAEFFYLKDQCGERPILLLDDVFSELDDHRAKNLLRLVEELSQTFITSTAPQYFENTVPFDGWNKMFLIRNGEVVQQKSPAVV